MPETHIANSPMNRRVVIISPLGYTGLAYYDYSLAESLQVSGNDVVLVTSKGWKVRERPRTFQVLPLYFDPSALCCGFIKGLLYLVATFNVILYLTKITSINSIIQFEMSELPCVDWIVFLFCHLRKLKIVYTPHEIVHNKNYPGNTFFMKIMYRLANKVVVLNAKNVKGCVDNYDIRKNKIAVIPHGNYSYFTKSISKSDARSKLGFHEDDELLLFFGTLRPDKGLDIVLDALQLLSSSSPKLKLVIAGKPFGDMSEASINSMILSRDLKDRVILHGKFIPDSDVDYYFCASDILLLTYRRVYESGVLNLAQTYGRAVICSDLPEFRESIEHLVNGMLFSANDSKALTLTISEILANREYDELGKRAQRISQEKGDWHMIASLYSREYRELGCKS